MRPISLLAGVVTIGALMSPKGARADDDDARFSRIVAHFDAAEGAETRWWVGWTTAYSVATVGYGVLAATAPTEGRRADAVVGAVKAGLAVGGMFVFATRTPLYAAGRLRAMDASTPAARAARLAAAERMLKDTAGAADRGTSWVPYVLGDAVNLAGFFVLDAGYRRTDSAWLGLVLGVVLSKATILTRPRSSIAAARALTPQVTLAPTPGGLTVLGTF